MGREDGAEAAGNKGAKTPLKALARVPYLKYKEGSNTGPQTQTLNEIKHQKP